MPEGQGYEKMSISVTNKLQKIRTENHSRKPLLVPVNVLEVDSHWKRHVGR